MKEVLQVEDLVDLSDRHVFGSAIEDCLAERFDTTVMSVTPNAGVPSAPGLARLCGHCLADGSRGVLVFMPAKVQAASVVDGSGGSHATTADCLTRLGELSGAFALSFNNVLHVVLSHLSFARTALTDGTDPNIDLEELEVAAHRGVELTSQLLAFDSRSPLERTPVRFVEVLESSIHLIERLFPPNVVFTQEVHARDAWILADRSRIHQIIVNLCINARDAMPDGGRLHLALSTTTHNVELIVRDDGVGMDDETLSRACEPFFTTKDPAPGRGLGLSTVFGLVSQHGGSFELCSTLGKGTDAKVRLPLHDAPSVASPAPALGVGRGTILVADDEPQIRRLLARVLTHHGFAVLTASNGADVLRILKNRQQTVDLVILDAVMPKPSGEELYERILALRPKTPVLFCSGYAAGVLSPQFLQDRKVPLLRKPFHPNELLAYVAQLTTARL